MGAEQNSRWASGEIILADHNISPTWKPLYSPGGAGFQPTVANGNISKNMDV